jgi:methanogenic corrinoid protein MtbC1
MKQVADTADRLEVQASFSGRGAGSGAAATPRHRRAALLARVVENQILPRLIEARAAADAAAITSEAEAAELVGLLLDRPAAEAVAYIETLRQRGVAPANLLLGIVAQAAKRLGDLWTDDRCNFADVTIGVGHLQQVVRALSPKLQAGAVTRPHPDSVLLLPAPGEQHSLGLVVLSEFFQREGWHVAGGPASSGQHAVRLVRQSWFDVVGFSIGSAHLLGGLTACIAAVRKASRNAGISVMVGGPLLFVCANLAQRTGADSAAADAPAAVREAKALLAFREAAD